MRRLRRRKAGRRGCSVQEGWPHEGHRGRGGLAARASGLVPFVWGVREGLAKIPSAGVSPRGVGRSQEWNSSKESQGCPGCTDQLEETGTEGSGPGLREPW